MPVAQKMLSDALGYMPLSRRRLDRQSKILLSLGFLSGIIVLWMIGLVRRLDSFGPSTSALDNYQSMCVSLSFLSRRGTFFVCLFSSQM